MLALVCLAAVFGRSADVRADGIGVPHVPLAQNVLPAPPAPAPARYYVVEGIVVTLLVAAAVFAICRNSGRT
jgi:hypothetical protein